MSDLLSYSGHTCNSLIFSQIELYSSAKAVDLPPIPLRRPAFRQLLELLQRLLFLRQLLPLFAAGVGFAVEGLRHGGGTPDFTKQQDFDLEFAAIVLNAEPIAGSDTAGRLRQLAI